ncbi:MAG TPA: PhoH family protein [Gemmatimonadota bacterium]|nr:PhoH family protein [Gemmatimonadota bacterium]
MKRYLLDTNVLLHDPKALTSFEENAVLLPIYVIEEIDRFKRQLSRLGEHARRISRFLDDLRRSGRLAEGVPLSTGGTLRVVFDPDEPERSASGTNGFVDTAILRIARRLRDEDPETPLVVVTKDVNLRIRADALGLRAEDYESDRVSLEGLYTGQAEIEVTARELERFRGEGELPLPEGEYHPNQYALLRDPAGVGNTALARIDTLAGRLRALIEDGSGVQGIRPRNKEQYFALDALLDPSLVLVTIMGKAGTGKTLLALAAGLQQVMADGVYNHLLVSRPTFPMGKDIGYLPGSVEEKLNPWMQPIYDNLALLLESDGGRGGRGGRTVEDLVRRGILAVEPLTHIRGRSIPQRFMLVDEAQNLTPLEVKTILTRVGERTKLVLTGDPWQIDTPYIDSSSNGFNHVVHHFADVPLAAHVQLVKGERSKLAEYAANLL